MSRKNHKSGFTLIELLVVIGIITILLALVFPLFRSAISFANTAKCSSNLHQIGLAMISFAADHDGFLPESGAIVPYDTNDGTTGQPGWCQQLEPYVGVGSGRGGSSTIYQCPDSSKIIPENQTYSYFNGAHAAYAQIHGFGPVNLQKMEAPEKHIIAGDIAFNIGFSATDADKDDYNQDPAFNGNSGTIPIHSGGANVVFADGHVLKAKKFDPATMTTVYDNNNTDYLTP